MRRGAWHQCGHLSQNIVEEQLGHGNGVGAIISPKDYLQHKAIEFAKKYKAHGAEVLIDPHFYGPAYAKDALKSYAITKFRGNISNLCKISDSDLHSLGTELYKLHKDLGADGVIAPAVAYEHARPDIYELNARLLKMAKSVGDALSVPTYATVVIGQSAVGAQKTLDNVLSHATSLNSDGFYYAFSFGASERIPSSYELVLRCCVGGLTLAASLKPVLHAFAGPMSLLSLGMGAQGAGIGHFQSVWQFDQGHFEGPAQSGGGGNAPARFFSGTLWGTIVYPDETARLPQDLQDAVYTHSPFSEPVAKSLEWPRFDSNKHLLFVMGKQIESMATTDDPPKNAEQAIQVLERAVEIHELVKSQTGLDLKDNTDSYQHNWRASMKELLASRQSDFEYISFLK